MMLNIMTVPKIKKMTLIVSMMMVKMMLMMTMKATGFMSHNLRNRTLTLVLLNLDVPCLCKQCRSRSVGF